MSHHLFRRGASILKFPVDLNVDSQLYITDVTPKTSSIIATPISQPVREPDANQDDTSSNFISRSKLSVEEAFARNGVERIDLSSSIRPAKLPPKDPLSDVFYIKAHRRAQRQEKSARNIEKEHAMHEKVQLESLLEGLKGHDWLKVMGISGITDSEKKLYEGKRKYFINEVEVLIEKFMLWKEEEKRRKVTKSKEEEDMSETQSSTGLKIAKTQPRRLRINHTKSADIEDMDAKAALQLQQEAKALSGQLGGSSSPAQKRARPSSPVPSRLSSKMLQDNEDVSARISEKSFGSFFEKSYQRDAALGSHRRGRSRLAFGQPVPELLLSDFNLSEDILTPEVMTVLQRKRRVISRGNDAS